MHIIKKMSTVNVCYIFYVLIMNDAIFFRRCHFFTFFYYFSHFPSIVCTPMEMQTNREQMEKDERKILCHVIWKFYLFTEKMQNFLLYLKITVKN